MNARKNRLSRVSATALIIGSLVGLTLPAMTAPIAQATWIDYQTSPAHSQASANLPVEYDVQQVHFGINDSNPGLYYFYLNFIMPVSANLYAGESGSYAAIQLDTNNDTKPEYELRTSTTPYLANVEHQGLFIDKTSGADFISEKCQIKTFTDLTVVSDWIGFTLTKGCLTLPSTIGIRGTSVYDPKKSNSIDVVPDAMWKLNLTGGSTTAATNASPDAKDLPVLKVPILDPVLAPDAAPTDLGAVAAIVTKSVVTLTCGTGLGTGWAVQVDMPKAQSALGYLSYIITNQHVVKDCLKSRNIDVALPNQKHLTGYLLTWDDDLDIAGILLKSALPGLPWTGSTPQQGWWAGIIGSPLGHPGILTEGIVSSVDAPSYLATTTAHINPGNSGGPVFDKTGRVIGIATSKYLGSEGFGIVHGAPMICEAVVKCSTKDVWSAVSPASVVTTSQNVEQLVTAAKALLAGATDVLLQLDIELAKAIKLYPNGAADLAKFKVLRPTVPSLTGVAAEDVSSISNFSDYVSSYHKLLDAQIDQIAARYMNVSPTVAPMSSKILKTTITCVKGKVTKTVTAIKPQCPVGYTLKKSLT